MPGATISDQRVIAEMVISGVESRRVLYEKLGLSKATITQSVNRLLKKGLVTEGARFNSSRVGRKTTLLVVKPDLAYFVGTDLEGTAVRVCVIDSGKKVIACGKRAIGPFWSKGKIIRQWRQLISETISSTKVDLEKVVGIGVGLPGMVKKKGIRTRACLPPGQWANFDFSETLKGFGYPVTAANNVVCVSEYERKLGAAMGVGNFISLLVRYGIGASMYSGDSLVVGEEVFIGEFAHMRVDIKGAKCVCGRKGCLDVFASGRTWSREKFTSEKLFQKDLEKRTFYLGVGLANLIKLYHPPLLIINGIYNEYENIVRPSLQKILEAELDGLKLSVPQIVFGDPVELKTSIGAAIRAAEAFLPEFLRKKVFAKS